jgi:hypothetical protein
VSRRPVATAEEIADEDHRARKLRQLVDISAAVIMQAGMTRGEAEKFVAAVRGCVLQLFPDGGDAYELIYAPRFARLIREFCR